MSDNIFDRNRLFPEGTERHVFTPSGRVAMVMSNLTDDPLVPTPVVMRCAGADGLLRFAGGTLVTDRRSQAALYGHVAAALAKFPLVKTVLMSGGTRVLGDDDRVVMSILELPALIREQWHPECFTLGSAPRTTPTTSLVGDHSTYIPSDKLDSNTLVHPGIDMFWMVQPSASHPAADWSGDVVPYFELIQLLRYATPNFATGLWVYGGGMVTVFEIAMALKCSVPCGVVRGSGRMADVVINWANNELHLVTQEHQELLADLEREHGIDFTRIATLNSPEATQAWLQVHKFGRLGD